MGRLVAAVIALAVFLTGAMYWSQANQGAEAAPDSVYPCVKATVQPAHSDTTSAAAPGDCAKPAEKSKCGCCCGKK